MITTLFALLALTAAPTSAFAAEPQPNIDWLCEGQTLIASHIAFNLVMQEHDGEDYGYKAMESFQINGQPTTPIDLRGDTAFCRWDKSGNAVLGTQTWKLEGRELSYRLECPNPKDLFEFQATCRDW